MKSDRQNITVLMGGNSPERPVSLKTGQAVSAALEALGYRVKAIDYHRDLTRWLADLRAADLVFLALHGGDGESGQVQAFLDLMGIPYTGTGPLGSGLCMDKHLSKLVLEHYGIHTPEWIMLGEGESIDPPFDFPVVVKPNDLGSTIGLSIVNEQSELAKAVDQALIHGDSALIERFIPGRELTVTILDRQALPIVEIRPRHGVYDYECKYTSGMSQYICPADLASELTETIQSVAESIFSVLKGRHYGRIDFRLDENDIPWCLEMNTLPGMTNTSLVPKAAAAAGMDFNTLVNTMVKLALQ